MGGRESGIAEVQAEEVVETAREAIGEDLWTLVEYDEDEYQIIYIAPWMRDQLGEAAVEETTERLHSYVNLDFIERDLFADLTPRAGEVRTQISRLEHATFVRQFSDGAGLFLSVAPEADLTALCQALDEAVREAKSEE